jgi:hypothetical protein
MNSKFNCDVTVEKDVNVICDTGAWRRLKSLGDGGMAAITAVVTLVRLLS